NKQLRIEKEQLSPKSYFDAEPTMLAPVFAPTQENLAIELAPITLVYQLEQCREDERYWGNVQWVFIGTLLGMFVNWATSSNPLITRATAVVSALLLAVVLLAWCARRKHATRAAETRKHIVP